jgi:hypothetical protein
MASTAASHTFFGVGKSGSPAPKLTTSIPAAFICFALSDIASVEEGLTAFAFFDNPVIVSNPFLTLTALGFKHVFEHKNMPKDNIQFIIQLSLSFGKNFL